MAATSHKRRNYFIKKGFQLKYTLSIVLTLLVVMFVSGLGLYLGMWGAIIENFSDFKVSQDLENVKRISDYEQARYKVGDHRLERIFREAELLSQKERETLRNAFHSVNRAITPKVLVLAIVIFIGGVFLSHKVAGPMYRIEKSAESICDGDLSVNFLTRRGDEMKKTTSALEHMVKNLHGDMQKLKTATIELEKGVNSLKDRISQEDTKRLQGIIKDIYDTLSRYKT